MVDAATDSTAFVRGVVGHLGAGLGQWLSGGLTSAGLPVPSHLDLIGILQIGVAVSDLAARRIDGRFGGLLPAPLVDVARRVPGAVLRGPAAVWGEVKTDIQTQTETVRLRGIGQRVGATGSEAPPAQAVTLAARRAEDERLLMLAALRRVVLMISAGQRQPLPLRALPQLRQAPHACCPMPRRRHARRCSTPNCCCGWTASGVWRLARAPRSSAERRPIAATGRVRQCEPLRRHLEQRLTGSQRPGRTLRRPSARPHRGQ